jgi:hypothetical protein
MARYGHGHHVHAQQAVDPVAGDVERPAVAEIELGSLAADELRLAFVDGLDLRVVRERPVAERGAQRPGDPFLRRTRPDDGGFEQELLHLRVGKGGCLGELRSSVAGL